MELLFVALGGLILGVIARFAFPRADRSGFLLVPAVGAVVASVVWVALTWAGLTWDGGVIWWLTLIAAAVAVTLVALTVGRSRERADEQRLATLMRPITLRPGQ